MASANIPSRDTSSIRIGVRRSLPLRIAGRLAVLLVATLIPAISFAQSGAQAASQKTWISDVTIISPEKLDHIEKGSVLIEDGRIIRVDRGSREKKPAGAKEISGKGQFLIPGLIDSHVHLASLPGLLSDEDPSKQSMVRAYFRQLPRSYLYYGYTTLVDLNIFEPKVLDDFRHTSMHPDVYDCGGSLPLANGYPMSFSPPEDRFKAYPNFIYDPRQADHIPKEFKPEDHTPEADVARVKASGGICVKTYFERGYAGEKNLPVIDTETFARVRKAATENGLVLMIHANSFEAQKFAVNGSVDVIAHGMWHWGSHDNDTVLPDEIKQLLDVIVAKRIGYQPTIQVMYGEMADFDPAYLASPVIAKIIPEEMIAWFHTPDGQWLKGILNPNHLPDEKIWQNYDENLVRRLRLVVRYLASKDANFLFGTDTISSPSYGNLPGWNGYLEMQQLAKTGLTPEQIFKAATINNAKEFKLTSEVGTIEPGKAANLVLMRSNPLQSIDAYDTITTVFVHGEAVERNALTVHADKWCEHANKCD